MEQQSKIKIKRLFSFLFNTFVQSDAFIALNALLVFIGWIFNIWVPMLCVLICINVIPLFIGKETKHLLNFLFMFTFVINQNRHQLSSYSWMLVFVALLIVGFIFSLIRFKRDWTCLHPKNMKGFYLSLILLIIPFAFAGVGSPIENIYAYLAALGLIIAISFGYTFFYVTNYDSKDKSRLMDYMLKIVFFAGIVVSFQAIYFYICNASSITDCIKTELDLGWGSKNNVSPILALCIPASLYFCIKKTKFVPFFLATAFLEYGIILLGYSRGSILVATIALPILLIYVLCKTESKKYYGFTLLFFVVVIATLVGVFWNKFIGAFNITFEKGLDSSGRTDILYPMAIDTFKTWPIFGAGWDYRLGEWSHDSYTPYWYHSTFFQILADMGICGLLFFALFYFWRYKTFLTLRKEPASICLMFALGVFDAYSMIDTNFFGPTFFIMLLTLTLVVELNVPENKCRAFSFIKFKEPKEKLIEENVDEKNNDEKGAL